MRKISAVKLAVTVASASLMLTIGCDDREPYVPGETLPFSKENCDAIRKDMSEAEVREIAGPPHSQSDQSEREAGRWAWTYSQSITDEYCTVTFAEGKVESAEYAKF